MNTNLYTAFDTIAEIFNRPFVEVNDATAVRVFTQSLQQNPNKNDYVLYKIGQYNDLNGVITPTENPIKIISGLEIPNESQFNESQTGE